MTNQQTGLMESKILPGPAGLLIRLLLLCWIVSKIICYQLWMGDRDFPIVPVLDGLLLLPAYWHNVSCWASLLLMAVACIKPGRKILLAIVVLELFSCLLDQNRWQPWQYQFIFMLAAYVVFKKQELLLLAWQIIIVSIYFFSGLSKLQPAFIHDIWNNLLLRNGLGIHTNNVTIFRLGYAVPLVEMGAALLLCFGRYRKAGAVLLICMHAGILILLGPLGLNRNEVIWPWNLLMPMLLVGLFIYRRITWSPAFFKHPFAWCLLALFSLLPWLQLVGRWDHYLSFSLYSGGVSQLYICTDDAATLQRMAPYMSSSQNGLLPCRFPVSAYQWGIKAMNSAPYPQQRVFRSIARQWQEQHPNATARFYIYCSGFKPTLVELIP